MIPCIRLLSAFLLGVCCVTSAVCAQEDAGSRRYIIGSRVPLRSGPSAATTAVGFLVANDAVTLRADKGSWCEVESLQSPLRGHCLCKYLGRQPFQLALLDANAADPKLSDEDRLNWSSRAFWVAPSLARWIRVGTGMETVFLSAEVRQREIAQQRPLRYKVPEFEAMKELLGKGITARAPTDPYASGPLGTPPDPEHLAKALGRAKLPAIRPSYFGEREAPFVIPAAPFRIEGATYAGVELADALSSFHSIAFRVEFTQPASYADTPRLSPPPRAMHADLQLLMNEGERRGGLLQVAGPLDVIQGVWDVAAVRVSFEKAARIHGLTRRGQPTATDIESMGIGLGASGGCLRGSLQLKSRSAREMAPWQDAVVAWVGKPPARGAAVVTNRQLEGKTPYDKLLIHDIDIDGDGVADFSVWAGRYVPVVGADGIWNAVFANVAGKWRRLAYDQDDDCT